MTQELHPALKDFRVFSYLVWRHLNLPEPTPVQYDIGAYLMTAPRRAVIEAFRGVGKSWLTSAYVCWELAKDPQKKILVVSASKERADAFSSFVKRLINEIPILQHLKTKEGQRDSMIAFDVGPALPDHSPSVKSVGITGQITGSRADILIADDIEVPNNSATQIMRDKLSEAVKEFDAILKPGGRIIYLGTPQTEMSLYNQLPERGYEIRIWPALFPMIDKIMSYKGRLAPMVTRALEADPSLQGTPVDPRRFNETDLMERKASYGRAGFSLQFMLDTSLSDQEKYPLKVQDLIVMAMDPNRAPIELAWANDPDLVLSEVPNLAMVGDRFYRPMWKSDETSQYTGCVMAIDPSGRGSDETGYAIIKMLTGTAYVVAAGGMKDGYSPETLQALARLAKMHQVKHIVVEANFGDGMYTALLKPILGQIYPCTVEEVKHSTQKEARIIDTLEPVISTHRLVIDPRVISQDYETAQARGTDQWQRYSLIYQMTRITRDKGAIPHDDRLDALAIAVNYWTEAMGRDQKAAAEAHREELLEAELRNFMGHVLGHQPEQATWISSNEAFTGR